MNLTVRVGTLSAVDRARIAQLAFSVNGDEPFQKVVSGLALRTGDFHAHYVPGVASGMLAFHVDALATDTSGVVSGDSGPVALVAGRAVPAMVTLGVPETGDMAGDGGTINADCSQHYALVANVCRWDDASLSGLTVSAGDLVPQFDPAIVEYHLFVPVSTQAFSIRPAVAEPTHSSILVDGVGVNSGAFSTAKMLNLGDNDIRVHVTAESGTTRDYHLVVQRGFAPDAYLKASNTRANADFSTSVAISDDTIVVGSWGESSTATGVINTGQDASAEQDTSAGNAGAAYVFVRSNGAWSQQAYLKASNTRAGPRFGYSAAISSDTIAVGSYQESSKASGLIGTGQDTSPEQDTSAVNAGAAYVFVRSNGAWAQQAYFKAPPIPVRVPFSATRWLFRVTPSSSVPAVNRAKPQGSSTRGRMHRASKTRPPLGAERHIRSSTRSEQSIFEIFPARRILMAIRCANGHMFDAALGACPDCTNRPTVIAPANRDPRFGFADEGTVKFSAGELGSVAAARLAERYRPLMEVTSGGMGKILLVQELKSGRHVALKVMLEQATSDNSLVQQFIREGVITARLEHPHIIPVYDLGFLGGELYYTMRFVDGKPLSHLMASLDLDERVRILASAAQAVDHAHAQGLWHRDLKPDNILVGALGEPYVIDWGLVTVQPGVTYQLNVPKIVVRQQAYEFQQLDKLMEQTSEAKTGQEGVLAGTPAYMAPEQVRAQDALMGARSDVWAFGIMLFEALTGRNPFADGTTDALALLARVINDPVPAARDLESRIPDELSALCVRMTTKEPLQRMQRLGEFVEVAQHWLRGSHRGVAAANIAASSSGDLVAECDRLRKKNTILTEITKLGLFSGTRKRQLWAQLAEL